MKRRFLWLFSIFLLILPAACVSETTAPVVDMHSQANGAWTTFSAPEWTQNGASAVISAIAATTDGALWFATAGGPDSGGAGLYRFDGQTWTRYTTQNGLPANEISSLAAAPDGSLWLTTFCCGVARLDSKEHWQYWTTQNNMPENDVRAVASDSRNNVWVGFSEKGLAWFDGATWQNFQHGYAGQITLLKDDSVLFSLSENSQPRLMRFSSEEWTTLQLPQALKETYVFDVAEMPDGAVWFATEKAGLFRFFENAWTQFGTDNGAASNTVLALAVAPDGALWCGATNGIGRFDGQNWETYYAGEWITSAFAAPDGTLWFGGSGKVLRYAPQSAFNALPSQPLALSSPSLATVTPIHSPTTLPTDWQEWRSPALNISLRYPANWQPQEQSGARGPDGFFHLESRPYARSLYDQLSHLCVIEANDPDSNARYGETPLLTDWQTWDSERNTWLGYGCLVSPNAPQAGLESVLFARDPARPDTLLILRADSQHFDDILSSLRFLETSPEPAPSGYYDSPHCREVPPAPAVQTIQDAGLTITEYAIASDTCHPIHHFDGFRARVNAPGLNMNTLWGESQRKTMQAANQKLAPFGLRLEERHIADPWVSFDLKNGDEILAANLVRLGQVSARPDETDFLFWAIAEDKNGSQFPILVTGGGAQSFSVWEQGFNSVWAGSRLVSFKYSETDVYPIGAPARLTIFADGLPIQTLSIPQMGAAGSPVRGLWNWDGQWVMEIRSTLFVDGRIKNQEWGYDEIFDWHLVNEKPFFAARRGSQFTLVYDGQELPVAYDDIAHGDVCCAAGLYDFQPLVNGAVFYARRDGVWFLVRVQAIEE